MAIFFSKHIGIVGSTGSGKSCTVAKILQAVGIDEATNKNSAKQKNSHVIIFDIHSEYSSAFKIRKRPKFFIKSSRCRQIEITVLANE